MPQIAKLCILLLGLVTLSCSQHNQSLPESLSGPVSGSLPGSFSGPASGPIPGELYNVGGWSGTAESFGGGDGFTAALSEIRDVNLPYVLNALSANRNRQILNTTVEYLACDFETICNSLYQNVLFTNTPQLCANRPSLSAAQQKQCSDVLFRNSSQLLSVLASTTAPKLLVYTDPIIVAGREVAAITGLDAFSDIVINQPLVRDTYHYGKFELAQLLGHEFMHKINDRQFGFIGDRTLIGTFNSNFGGEQLLDSIGYALAFSLANIAVIEGDQAPQNQGSDPGTIGDDDEPAQPQLPTGGDATEPVSSQPTKGDSSSTPDQRESR